MCTIAILYGVAHAPLVVAANRDEAYARPTRPPERLAPGVAGGVDVLAGGTWLAVHARGFFAAVTNKSTLDLTAPPFGGAARQAQVPDRVPQPQGLRSRGLVVRELASAPDPDAYVAALDPRAYASMNLAWGDARATSVAYLRREDGSKEIVRLAAGVHVLCNDRLGAPEYLRADRVARAVEPCVAAPWPELERELERILGDNTTADPPPSSPLPPDLSRALTATCIHSPGYGTRSSTIVAIDRDRVRAYRHADGPPCTTAYVDRMELLA